MTPERREQLLAMSRRVSFCWTDPRELSDDLQETRGALAEVLDELDVMSAQNGRLLAQIRRMEAANDA